MRIAINFQIVDGPWGGGNRFVRSLSSALLMRGHTVDFDLHAPDIDIILMVDPRTRVPNVSFGPGAILRYLAFRNPRAGVIHRINECDERKGTKSMNRRLKHANYVADETIFVGSWLRDLNLWENGRRNSVVLNGADPKLFFPDPENAWTPDQPLRLVTHHWGGNWMKGFDIYQRLDQMLTEPAWRDRIAFTYVGNVPRNFMFKNATHLPPMDAAGLCHEIRSHHVYVTASICEPGGNHQNEGALCGLPLLYRNSGCLPEYCDGFGVMFEGLKDFESRLAQITADYPGLRAKMPTYPNVCERTIEEFVKRIEKLQQDCYAGRVDRSLWRNPLRAAGLLIGS